MTYRGYIRNGEITLDALTRLPEGTELSIEVVEPEVSLTSPMKRVPLRRITPIEMPGDSLADELVRDRR